MRQLVILWMNVVLISLALGNGEVSAQQAYTFEQVMCSWNEATALVLPSR